MGNDRAIERGEATLDARRVVSRAKVSTFPRVWLDDAKPEVSDSYLVKGVIDRGKLIVIYGPTGDGKTFFTVDLAGHVAADIPWRDRRVKRGLVVYVAAEAGASVLRRFYAWGERRLGEAREERIPLAIITRPVNLLNTVEVEALLVELRAIAAEAQIPVALVIFDTLSRSMPGGDENSSGDLTRVIAAADMIRDQLGAATAFVHHTGKNAAAGARGHSSLCAAADTVISVVQRVATVEKVRDGTAGERFAFDLDVVDLGADADGESVTTCIVTPTESAKAPIRAPQLSGVGKVALQALHEAVAENGRIMPETSTIPRGVKAIQIGQWRARFKLRYGSDDAGDQREQDAIKTAFRRGREQLAKLGVIGISDPYAWANDS